MGDRETEARQCYKVEGIYFIDPEDQEFKETMQNARKMLDSIIKSSMPCLVQNIGHGETNPILADQNMHASWSPYESTRKRIGKTQ